jgi:hypothetical protein
MVPITAIIMNIAPVTPIAILITSGTFHLCSVVILCSHLPLTSISFMYYLLTLVVNPSATKNVGVDFFGH